MSNYFWLQPSSDVSGSPVGYSKLDICYPSVPSTHWDKISKAVSYPNAASLSTYVGDSGGTGYLTRQDRYGWPTVYNYEPTGGSPPNNGIQVPAGFGLSDSIDVYVYCSSQYNNPPFQITLGSKSTGQPLYSATGYISTLPNQPGWQIVRPLDSVNVPAIVNVSQLNGLYVSVGDVSNKGIYIYAVYVQVNYTPDSSSSSSSSSTSRSSSSSSSSSSRSSSSRSSSSSSSKSKSSSSRSSSSSSSSSGSSSSSSSSRSSSSRSSSSSSNGFPNWIITEPHSGYGIQGVSLTYTLHDTYVLFEDYNDGTPPSSIVVGSGLTLNLQGKSGASVVFVGSATANGSGGFTTLSGASGATQYPWALYQIAGGASLISVIPNLTNQTGGSASISGVTIYSDEFLICNFCGQPIGEAGSVTSTTPPAGMTGQFLNNTSFTYLGMYSSYSDSLGEGTASFTWTETNSPFYQNQSGLALVFSPGYSSSSSSSSSSSKSSSSSSKSSSSSSISKSSSSSSSRSSSSSSSRSSSSSSSSKSSSRSSSSSSSSVSSSSSSSSKSSSSSRSSSSSSSSKSSSSSSSSSKSSSSSSSKKSSSSSSSKSSSSSSSKPSSSSSSSRASSSSSSRESSSSSSSKLSSSSSSRKSSSSSSSLKSSSSSSSSYRSSSSSSSSKVSSSSSSSKSSSSSSSSKLSSSSSSSSSKSSSSSSKSSSRSSSSSSSSSKHSSSSSSRKSSSSSSSNKSSSSSSKSSSSSSSTIHSISSSSSSSASQSNSSSSSSKSSRSFIRSPGRNCTTSYSVYAAVADEISEATGLNPNLVWVSAQPTFLGDAYPGDTYVQVVPGGAKEKLARMGLGYVDDTIRIIIYKRLLVDKKNQDTIRFTDSNRGLMALIQTIDLQIEQNFLDGQLIMPLLPDTRQPPNDVPIMGSGWAIVERVYHCRYCTAFSAPQEDIDPLDLVGEIVFGEQKPTGGVPQGWQTWDDGNGNPATVIGDPQYGQLSVPYGGQARSSVYNWNNNGSKNLIITLNQYQPGSGNGTIWVRGSATEFEQDDNVVPWIIYTGTTPETWQYIQIKVTKP